MFVLTTVTRDCKNGDLYVSVDDNAYLTKEAASTALRARYEDFLKSMKLEDNGIASDEAETVLQAIGYILLDKELYPADKEGEACVNMAISINEAKLKKAEQCLIDNGIEPDEAETVLQAIGYILLDKELYPATRED